MTNTQLHRTMDIGFTVCFALLGALLVWMLYDDYTHGFFDWHKGTLFAVGISLAFYSTIASARGTLSHVPERQVIIDDTWDDNDPWFLTNQEDDGVVFLDVRDGGEAD